MAQVPQQRNAGNGGLLQEEEVTLLELSNELEEVTGRMRRAVIDMVHRARDRLHEAAARELEMRRAAQDLEHQQLIEQLDNMQALAVKHSQDMEAKDDFVDRLLAVLYRLRGTNKEKSLMRKCLRAWRGLIGRGGWVEGMGDYLQKQKRDLLLRRALHGWRNEAGRAARDRKLANITSLHESELQRLKADSELTTSALKVELIGCQDQLARGNEEKAILQERLKSHMMRGMCALNAEATMLLRGMATESGMQMSLPENIPPVPGHFVKQNQQTPVAAAAGATGGAVNFPEYGGAAGQGSAATDQLLQMQAGINAQLNQYQGMPDGYVAGQHSVNNNNSSSGGGTAASRGAAPSARPPPAVNTPTGGVGSRASSGRRDSGSLVSFNNSHPANNGSANLPRPASQRSTPSRR